MKRTTRILLTLGLVLSVSNVTAAVVASSANTWIAVNALGAPPLTNGYRAVWDLTPSVSTNIPHSAAYRNDAFRFSLRLKEGVVAQARASATYGGRIMASYDIRNFDAAPAPTVQEDIRLAWRTNHTLLTADYFRGRLCFAENIGSSNEWITVFASEDLGRLVTVCDSGPISISENIGSTWQIMVRPANYEFTLSTTPRGSAVVALVALTQEYANAAAKALPKIKSENWYCAASAADGSQIVLTGGPSQSAPALSITRSSDKIVVKWPGSFTGFVLQQCDDLAAAHWTDVAAQAEIIDAHNQVTLPYFEGRNFFRLKKE